MWSARDCGNIVTHGSYNLSKDTPSVYLHVVPLFSDTENLTFNNTYERETEINISNIKITHYGEMCTPAIIFFSTMLFILCVSNKKRMVV